MNLPIPQDLTRENDRRVVELRRGLYPLPSLLPPRRLVRRRVGHQLVRVGLRLAADQRLEAAISR